MTQTGISRALVLSLIAASRADLGPWKSYALMRALFFGLALAVALSTSAAAQTGALSIASKYSVAETVDRLEAAIKAAGGYSVFGRVDYQAVAASQGGKIRPHRLILFGRGAAVEKLFTAAPTLGLDLPLKVLIWEAPDGTVKVTYNTAEFLEKRHSAHDIAPLLQRITNSTASFAKKAAE
jgi:uncharacterized protein (DUF302 family)